MPRPGGTRVKVQRDLNVNEKVQELFEMIVTDSGVIIATNLYRLLFNVDYYCDIAHAPTMKKVMKGIWEFRFARERMSEHFAKFCEDNKRLAPNYRELNEGERIVVFDFFLKFVKTFVSELRATSSELSASNNYDRGNWMKDSLLSTISVHNLRDVEQYLQ